MAETLNLSILEEGARLVAGMTPGPWEMDFDPADCGFSERDMLGLVWLRNHASTLIEYAKQRESLLSDLGEIDVLLQPLSMPADPHLPYGRRIVERARDAQRAVRFRDESIAKVKADQDTPIPMILHCPRCHRQHVDVDDETDKWATEKHHKTHLCLNPECGTLFRPSNRYTVGVQELPEVAR